MHSSQVCLGPRDRTHHDSHSDATAGLSLSAVAGSNTSVYVSCIVQEYDTLYAYDEEIDAKYAGMWLNDFL